MKVKTQIFKCTGLMLSDLGNPYIHSATALCDIAHTICNIFSPISDYSSLFIFSILNTNFFKCEMKCIVNVKTRIFKYTGLMPSDLGNPYTHSATALCDKRNGVSCVSVEAEPF